MGGLISTEKMNPIANLDREACRMVRKLNCEQDYGGLPLEAALLT
jgi:hypothetical protein